MGLLERITARKGEALAEPAAPSPSGGPAIVECRVLPEEFWWEVSRDEDSGKPLAVLIQGITDEAGEFVGQAVKTVEVDEAGLRAAESGRGEALLQGTPYTPMLAAETEAAAELEAPCRDLAAWRLYGEHACEQAMRSALAEAAAALEEVGDVAVGDLRSVVDAAARAQAATGRAMAALRVAETGLLDVTAMACEEAAEIGRAADMTSLVEDAAERASAEVTARETPVIDRALEQAIRAKEAELARGPLEEPAVAMPRRERPCPEVGRLAWSRWPAPGDDERTDEGAK